MPLAPGGYAWWYIDAESDDGREALSLIVFVGSVFSPYYWRAHHAAPSADLAAQHCAINVAVYSRQKSCWSLTEQRRIVSGSATDLRLGKSTVAWHRGRLRVQLNELTSPWRRPLRGTVELTPQGEDFSALALHSGRPHMWWPVAPCARVAVHLETPRTCWEGRAYHDANWGHEPLARAFTGWTWQRAWHPEGTLVHYDAQSPVAGAARHAALYRLDGAVQPMQLPQTQALPTTAWGLQRQCLGHGSERRRLEDTPFYSRSQLDVEIDGQALRAMHEQLNLRRFMTPWVRFLLPFRMQRRP